MYKIESDYPLNVQNTQYWQQKMAQSGRKHANRITAFQDISKCVFTWIVPERNELRELWKKNQPRTKMR